MLNIIKIILFVLVNIAGFYMIPIIAGMSLKLGVFPQLPPGHHTEVFKLWFFGGGMWVLVGCVLVSTGYFFARNELKNWLLFAPMYGTAIFGTLVILYFNFMYTIT